MGCCRNCHHDCNGYPRWLRLRDEHSHYDAGDDHSESDPHQHATNLQCAGGLSCATDTEADGADSQATPPQQISKRLFAHTLSSCANFSTSFFSPNCGNCTVIFASSPSPSRLYTVPSPYFG